MVEGLPTNPSRYDMPKPSRFVLLDDLSGDDLFLIRRTSELTLLIDTPQPAVKIATAQLTNRLRRKYMLGSERGIYPQLDLTIGVGSTGFTLAENLDLGAPLIKITPFRSKDPNGNNVIFTRSGLSLVQEITAAKNLIGDINKPTVGIIDDTIFSGKTLSEIHTAIENNFSEFEIIMLALVSVPAFLPESLRNKVKIISGLQIKTNESRKSGLNSVDMKDIITDDGLHLADGSSIAFMNEENWMRSWFGPNYNQAIAICQEIRAYLQNST